MDSKICVEHRHYGEGVCQICGFTTPTTPNIPEQSTKDLCVKCKGPEGDCFCAATTEQSRDGLLALHIRDVLCKPGFHRLSAETKIKRLVEAISALTTPEQLSPLSDGVVVDWMPHVGEQVVINPDSADWASDWVDAAGNPMVLWVAAVEAIPGGGVNVTVSEEWPIKARGAFSGATSLTDGFCVGRDEIDHIRPLAALSRPSLEPSVVSFELVWNAAARPPVHPDKMRGEQSFASAEEAMARFRGLADDAEFVSLTKVTTFREDAAALQRGEGETR